MSFFRRKNMKKYSYRKLLIILFMLNLFAITVFYIKYCKSQLPNTIHIKKGETLLWQTESCSTRPLITAQAPSASCQPR